MKVDQLEQAWFLACQTHRAQCNIIKIHELRHNKTNKWVCVQWRLRSAWAPAQSDQSLRCPRIKLWSLATHWAHSEDSDQTGRMPRLIWVFAGRTVTLLVLSCGGSHETAEHLYDEMQVEKVSYSAWIKIWRNQFELGAYHFHATE